MRTLVALVSILALSACGGASSGAEVETAGEPAIPRVRVLGSGPRVLLAQVRVPAGGSFSLPTSACQDVLAYVREGAASLRSGAVLVPGRSVRFGAGGARLGNPSQRPLRLYVIVSRHVATRFGPDALFDMQRAPEDSACGSGADGVREGDPDRAGPFEHAEGRLRVSLLLDEEGQGARHASLTRLEGEASVAVPRHQHEESAEVIFIEDGEGTMRVGDQTVSIRPGTFLYIPPRTDHDFRPTGNRPLRAMQAYAPAGPEQRFRPEPVDGTDQAGTWQAEQGEAAPTSQGEGAADAPASDAPADTPEAPEIGEEGG